MNRRPTGRWIGSHELDNTLPTGSAGTGGKSRWFTWIWLTYWAGLFVVMHIPLGGVKLPVSGGDKAFHFMFYLALALLGGRAAMQRGQRITPRWALVWFGIYAAYGAADELLQALVQRTPSVGDWLADTAGVLAGLAVIHLNRHAMSAGGAELATKRDPDN